jgi:hypothetical protein
LATWNQCHIGLPGCELAPRSRTEYAWFHLGEIETREGGRLAVGRITVGEAGHAPVHTTVGAKAAIEHYDRTGCVAAFVRAKDGRHGIWLAGAVRSDCPAEKVRDLQANPPSGDWRNGELVAALSVPVPGFPIPRVEYAVVATGAIEDVVALVATGYTEHAPPTFTRGQQRRRTQLRRALREAVGR